ncbi:MAG: hypothetical protein COU69_01580 [Candidatus Pacebacteria bacterium CG10_big_fil_rev_8_21_14_0_10_56_10]|nr:MAG: hypothetical protein COU69_01580 [Candidatus Pacebacteria bacterium CG10_big_fil_rev_8_21_14_0_10_56_10]
MPSTIQDLPTVATDWLAKRGRGQRGQARLVWLASGLIILLAVVLRTWRFGSVPTSLYWDEMAILVDAKSVAQSGLDMHGNHWLQTIFPSYGDFKLPVQIWLTALVVKLVGPVHWAVRLPSLVAGLATVVLAGVLTEQLLKLSRFQSRALAQSGRFLGVARLFAMLAVAISPWSITFSRTGFEGHLGQFWLALSVWAMLKSSQRWWWGAVAGVLGALATYSYFSVRFVWPGVLLVVMAVLIWRQLSDATAGLSLSALGRKGTTLILVPTAVFLALLVPMLRSPWYQPSNQFRLSTPSVLNANYAVSSNQLRELAGNTFVDRLIFHRHWLLLRSLLENVADHLDASYLFLTGDDNLRHGTGQHGLHLAVMLPFLLAGLYYLGRYYRPALVILMSWWAWSLLPASVPLDTPHALRSLNALVPTSLIIAAGLAASLEYLRHRRGRCFLGWSQLTLVAVTAAIALSVWQFSWFYFGPYPVLSGKWWQGGYNRLAVAAVERRRQVDHVVVIEFDDRFHLWLMAQDAFTARDFHSWESQNFKFRRFDNIIIDEIKVVDDYLDKSNSLVVIGLSQQVEKMLRDDFRIEHQEIIDDIPGQQPLQVVTLIKR